MKDTHVSVFILNEGQSQSALWVSSEQQNTKGPRLREVQW